MPFPIGPLSIGTPKPTKSDLPFGELPRQKLDLYRPQNAPANLPVIIFFYGGGWRSGAKADYRFAAQAFTSRGFLVVIPDYRIYPEGRFPKFVTDGALATRWVRDHAQEYGGDPDQIFLMGHSSGGHLAAMLATDPQYLKAVGMQKSDLSGLITLSAPLHFRVGHPIHRKVFQGHPRDSWQPIHFVDGTEPPMLLLHGRYDWIVWPRQAEEMATRVRAKGGDATARYYRIDHLGIMAALSRPFRFLAPTLRDSLDFLRSRS